MGDFDNTNKGALFVNDRKEGDNDRDFSGTLNVSGKEFWLSGWRKTSKSGTKFLSLSIKPKDGDNKPKAKPDFNDDVDF